MKEKTSWCTEKDVKLKKVKKEYLKNVKMIEDDGLEREVGEIDFLKIPRKELLYVLNTMHGLRYKHNFDDCSYDEYDHKNDDYYMMTDEMMDFESDLSKNFDMYKEDLFDLFKEFTANISNKKEYQTFTKMLDKYCKLNYIDCDDHEYCYYNEHEHPKQEEIDHNHVGEYEFIVTKPIPMKTIQSMIDFTKIDEETESL